MNDAAVAPLGICGNNGAVEAKRTPIVMVHDRWPIISTSVSGVAAEDWDAFKARAKRDKIKQRDALETAVSDLAAAARRGDHVEWQPAKVAPSRSVKMHNDVQTEINNLVGEFGYKQNVVVATAMHRWTNRP